MTRGLWSVAAIVLVALLAYPIVTLAGGAPRFPTRSECVRPAVEGRSVDVVFGRFDDPLSAAELRDQTVSVGFIGTEALPDGCGRWKVVLEDVPSVDTAREIQREAGTVDLEPTLELGSDG